MLVSSMTRMSDIALHSLCNHVILISYQHHEVDMSYTLLSARVNPEELDYLDYLAKLWACSRNAALRRIIRETMESDDRYTAHLA